MKKKALILGTNAGQADIIRYLKAMGWETHVCGYKQEGPGCELADYFYLINIVDIESVKDLAANIKADIVYSVSSDIAITAATKVSEMLNLPHLLNSDIINLFNNKNEFRSFLNKNNIGYTRYIVVKREDDLDELYWDEYPCVVKPVDSQGQRGVGLVKDSKELIIAVKNAFDSTNSSRVIIEEFLDGAEFSTNVVVQGGKILLNEFSDRIVFDESYFGLPKGHRIPVTYINDEQLEISKLYVRKIVENLNITDAVLYIQMKLKGDEPRVIEIAPRLDGCHIWRLIKYSRGVDLRELAIKCLLGEKIDISHYAPQSVNKVLEFYHIPTGNSFDIRLLDVKDNTLFTEFRYENGDKIIPINGKLEVVGYSIYNEN
ncbi:ATP-grasp domain-containing protein [Riemerella anatipestifer]|uniref:ATP-grasp domain-containing protein n=1 Tax=Riemerella anatipestifer TaxID=34085 RepID=UPI002A8C6A72|nr:ATP-grasp domain-containing protein [Riemerella anatipestifer]